MRAHLPPLARALVAALAAITVDTAVADSSTPRLAAYYDRHMAICGGEAYEWSGDETPAECGARRRSRLVHGLKGAAPGEPAVEPPGKIERVFNLETAKVRRPTTPSPVLPRADDVTPWHAPACAGHAGAAADKPPG